jgi:cell wall-associated NlpC family hydrolase
MIQKYSLKFFFFFLSFLSGNAFAQTNSDRAIAERFLQSATPTTIDSLMIQAALYLRETPYVAETLERTDSDKEELVVNLRESDCTTFVENCLALSRTKQLPSPNYNSFEQELQKIRYRKGFINGYVSRLHYTTDWIYDNVEKGTIEDVTYALGGRKFKPNVHYMSENYEKYLHLAKDSIAVQQIVLVEQKINARSNYYYIPKKEIAQRQSLIKSGDIICFTTSTPGLDVSHMAIAYRHNGELTFIHASSKAKKVIVNPQSLIDYCSMIQTCTGIIVLRPVNVVING